MGVTITAVPVAANVDAPAPQPPTERALSDFVANIQNSPMSGMPNLANPAALAGEVFSNLRGIVEKTQKFQSPRIRQSPGTDSAGVVAASFSGEPPADPQSSPAGSEPDETGSAFRRVRASGDQVVRAADMIAESLNFMVEVQLVGQGTSLLPQTVNTLLRGQ
jgi:hypothetical protein